MRHHYEVTVSKTDPDAPGSLAPIHFAFENHDDLHQIIERLRAKALFASDEEPETFCVGLKLLGQVLMLRRAEEPFKDFALAFGVFMKTLKAR
jgi:hypothetical protein